MNKLKFSLIGQMLLVLRTHFTTSVLFMVVFLLTTSMQGEIGSKIFASVGTLGYFLTIYASATKTVSYDRLSVSPLEPKPLKGLILPAFIVLSNIIMVILYRLAWSYASDGESMTEVWGLLINIASLLWVSPYQAFLGMDCGNIAYYGYLLLFLLPITASFLGYLAGYYGFDLSQKVHGIAYEKKKDK